MCFDESFPLSADFFFWSNKRVFLRLQNVICENVIHANYGPLFRLSLLRSSDFRLFSKYLICSFFESTTCCVETDMLISTLICCSKRFTCERKRFTFTWTFRGESFVDRIKRVSVFDFLVLELHDHKALTCHFSRVKFPSFPCQLEWFQMHQANTNLLYSLTARTWKT